MRAGSCEVFCPSVILNAMKNLNKKTLLVVSANDEKRNKIRQCIENHVSSPTIYEAGDGSTAFLKAKNAPPHVIITDLHLPKVTGVQFIKSVLGEKSLDPVAILVCEAPPEEAIFIDEFATSQVQFVCDEFETGDISKSLARALNYVSYREDSTYHLRFLSSGDILMKEGDKGEFVYFVSKGNLRAYRDTDGGQMTLGEIEVGEFVGEMAYINGEVRSASVVATTDCELIEVPAGHFETLLYKRPSWSKALMLTLSKRVRKSNNDKARTSQRL